MKNNNNSDVNNIKFQAEVNQILNLMINSLYSNKEIFLRELISNASDACDRLRFESIKDHSITKNNNFRIKIKIDLKQKNIIVIDNGIGMSKEDAIKNLGTIAKSGTKNFLSKLTGDDKKDSKLIGQFGVGFYSSFMVAEKVSIESRKIGILQDEGIEWSSGGCGDFSISNKLIKNFGTSIVLKIKKEDEIFLNGWKLREIIKKYSDHISLPIDMLKEKWNEKTSKMETTDNWETVNQGGDVIWKKNKKDISKQQYIDFYKYTSHDFEEPLTWTHNHIEGSEQYTQLLFIPKISPFNIWDRDLKNGIKLYVKNIFIMDNYKKILPTYLRFVRGIIDSDNLPLNVSREMLQESRSLKIIRESSIKRILLSLENLSKNNKENYNIFWKNFGQVLKEGIGEDEKNKEKISKLIRFSSTKDHNKNQEVSLDNYFKRMKKNQNKIYFLTSENFNSSKNNPHLEIFKKKNIEVLLLWDRIDEWMMSNLKDFNGKKIISISKGKLNFENIINSPEKNLHYSISSDLKFITDKIFEKLKKYVKNVRVTVRLVDSPSCLVVEENDISPHLQRLMSISEKNFKSKSLPILEINPNHSILKLLINSNCENIEDWSLLLLNQAMLTSGAQLQEPVKFINIINNLLIPK